MQIAAVLKKVFTRGRVLTALSLLPLAVFLRVARHYGFTEDAWRRAFLCGAALSAGIMGAAAARRVPFRDLLLAFGLLFVTGAAAFLADFRPALEAYRRFQGSAFMAWYLLVRAVFYFTPGLLSGFVFDPYRKAPRLAAALAAGVFAWSLFFRDVLVSTVLPMTLMLALLSPVERGTSADGA